jgi:hypothetical protein
VARPMSPQQMAADYDEGVRAVTQQDYCARQIELGVSPDVCARRYQRYQQRAVGKGQKMVQRWQTA